MEGLGQVLLWGWCLCFCAWLLIGQRPQLHPRGCSSSFSPIMTCLAVSWAPGSSQDFRTSCFFVWFFFKRPSYEADSVLRHVGSPPLAGQAGTVGHTAMDEPARELFWNPPFPPGLCRWRR